jgi:xanthine dehydrogenase small subunit
MRDFVLLYVNGRRHELRGAAAFAPLSTLLRRDLELTGTKVVCAEGDCGACAVLVGRPDEAGGFDYHPVASCIAFAYQFDGAHVVTVEGLRSDGEPLNPVQQAMVACHGAQCGYCTPGFVVSLCGLFDRDPAATDDDARAALVGNLCRCTGYESILAAARRVDRARLRPLDALYPPAEVAAADLSTHAADDLLVADGPRRFFKPATLAAAVAFKAAHPDCAIVAGGTDLGVYANKGLRSWDVAMSLANVPGLDRLDVADDALTAGANVTLAQMERATREHFPELHPMFLRHGSPLIRNAGTLAGNLANASSIGDAIPALFVLRAQLELTGARGTRQVNADDFYTGYKQTALAPDELITAVRIPRLGPREALRLYKVSKRHDLDISTFTAAIWAKTNASAIADIRIAFGGVGPTVARLPRAESSLRGKSIADTAAFAHAARLAREEISPISDVRGSLEYRRQLAENILLKFQLEMTHLQRVHP